jgi:hypothetical protein
MLAGGAISGLQEIGAQPLRRLVANYALSLAARRVLGDGIAERTFAAVLQAFCRHFQINAVPTPSISKECFGGFVGFQRVTIDPNFFQVLQPFEVPAFRKAPPRRENATSMVFLRLGLHDCQPSMNSEIWKENAPRSLRRLLRGNR